MSHRFGFSRAPWEKPLSAREQEKRSVLREYSLAGGERFATGEFMGTIIRIEAGKVLLHDLSVQFKGAEGKVIKGKEDHVWIEAVKAFRDAGAGMGDRVKFNAYTYKYRRADGLSNYGLCRPKNIRVL